MALEWLDCADCFFGRFFGGLGSTRRLGLLWPSLGWRLALQGVWGLGIRCLLWGFRFQKTSGVPPVYARKLQSLTGPKSSTPPVLFVISLALHGATALNSEPVPRPRIVVIELQCLHVAGLQGSGTGGDDLAPFLQVDFQQHPYKSN